MIKIRNFDLPEFALLDGDDGKEDYLNNRIVVLHIRSATILEFIHKEDVAYLELNDDVPHLEFIYHNKILNIDENITCAVHYCATLDKIDDLDTIITKIMKPAIEWYCNYLKNEDSNMKK